MKVNTRVFGEVDIEEEKIIRFVGGLVGFPDMVDFALIHNEERGPGGISWLQSMQEEQFALPVMDPLLIKEDYNPKVEDELLKPLGEFGPEDLLVLVTVNVPIDIKNMEIKKDSTIISGMWSMKGSAATMTVAEDGRSVTLKPVAGAKGKVTVFVNLNGKKYKTSVKILGDTVKPFKTGTVTPTPSANSASGAK